MSNHLTIQDFALYLGAPCRCLNGLGKVKIGTISYVTPKNGLVFVRWPGDFDISYPHFQITPILRHRDSLTEAESQELYEVVYGRKWDPLVGSVVQPCLELWWHSADDGLCYPLADLIGDPKGWRWLLAHHFDLFGWIEAGLALDAAKQKTV